MKEENKVRNPLVSVCIITYNHQAFICEAIEGVLMQQVGFSIEIIIADDCSTDGTREILLQYKEKYPALIKLILQQKNVGPAQNWLDLISEPTAKYIAYFEGDDYWTDPNKLQKQVDFLEENSDYAICHHAYNIFDEETKQLSIYDTSQIPNDYDIQFLSKKNTIGTLTVMYRNQITFPDWFLQLNYGDYPMHLLNAQFGKIKYFTEEMAVYRRHPQGATGTFKSIESPLYLLQPLEILFNFFADDKVVNKNLGLQILNLYVTVFYHYHSLKDVLNSALYFEKIRSLKNLFREDDLEKELLIQIYLYKIKDFTQSKDSKALSSIIGDFQDDALRYLLQHYAKEVSLSNKLAKSKSYRLGNKVISPAAQMLRLMQREKK